MKQLEMINLSLVCVAALALSSGCDKDKESKDQSADKSESTKGDEAKKTVDSPKAVDSKKADDSKKAAGEGTANKSLTKQDDGWTTYSNEQYGFSVDAPVAVQKGEEKVPTVVGVVTAYTFSFNPPGAQGAMIATVTPNYVDDVTKEELKEMMDNGQAGSLQQMGAELVSADDIELDGSPGRVFSFIARPQPGIVAIGTMKMFIREGAMYQAMMVHMEGSANDKAQGERFVESFKFTKKS